MKQLRKQLIEETKKKIVESFDRETLIIETSRFLRDLDSAISKLRLRLKLWYSNFDHEVEDVLKVSWKKSSLGVELKKEDLEILKENLEQLKSLVKLREVNVKYLEKLMKKFWRLTIKGKLQESWLPILLKM